MHCPERERLLAQYHHAVRTFSELVGRLSKLSGAGFSGAYVDSDRAREDCEQAREELERHTEAHGCGSLGAAAGT